MGGGPHVSVAHFSSLKAKTSAEKWRAAGAVIGGFLNIRASFKPASFGMGQELVLGALDPSKSGLMNKHIVKHIGVLCCHTYCPW
jgi:hypothetical protein